MKIILNLLCLAFASLPLGAPSLAANLSAGGEIFHVVPPKGLVDFTGRNEFLDALAIQTSGKRFLNLATYFTEEDVARSNKGQLPLANRYAMLAIHRDFLARKMTAKEFISYRNKVRDEMEQEVRNLSGKVDLSDTERFLRDRTGIEAAMKINDMVPLGVQSESNRHIGYEMLFKTTTSVKGKTISSVLILEMNLVYTRQKILFLKTYAYVETPEDITWVRKISAEFVNNLIRDNPHPPPRQSLKEGKTIYDEGQGIPKDDSEAVKWYRKAAEQGHADAQYNLGVMYYKGQGVPQDYTEALKWYRKAAEQGHADAQYILGIRYSNGQGVPQDDTEAVKWYRKAAEGGNAHAQFRLGLFYYRGVLGVSQDYAKAVKWYRKAAEQGNLDAQLELGDMYDFGYYVPRDYAESAKWYLKAAEQGSTKAQCRIGTFYENGMGVPQHYAKAVKWYREAAETGQDRGMQFLGRMYEKGLGVPQDMIKAHMWFNLAVVTVSSSSMNKEWVDLWMRNYREDRDRVASKMTPAQIAEAQRLAEEWKQKKEGM
jgi:TPR repeat protein